MLIEYFLTQFSRTIGRSVRTVVPEVLTTLATFDWPGNVRQLQSVLKYSVIHAAGEVITPDCLPENLLPERAAPPGVGATGGRSAQS